MRRGGRGFFEARYLVPMDYGNKGGAAKVAKKSLSRRSKLEKNKVPGQLPTTTSEGVGKFLGLIYRRNSSPEKGKRRKEGSQFWALPTIITSVLVMERRGSPRDVARL